MTDDSGTYRTRANNQVLSDAEERLLHHPSDNVTHHMAGPYVT